MRPVPLLCVGLDVPSTSNGACGKAMREQQRSLKPIASDEHPDKAGTVDGEPAVWTGPPAARCFSGGAD